MREAPGSAEPRGKKRRPRHDEGWATVRLCVDAIHDKKGYDVAVLDLRGLAAFADYFVIASGRSDTHVRAIIEGVEQSCRQAGVRPLAIEGERTAQWALVDFGDVVVHVFYEPVREFYDLERLWSQSQRCVLPESPPS